MAMAQQLAQDPAFMEMTQQLQQQMGGLMGGARPPCPTRSSTWR